MITLRYERYFLERLLLGFNLWFFNWFYVRHFGILDFMECGFVNIIVLDLDGVLVTFKSQKPESYGKMLKDFDEEMTSPLVKLCEQNDDVRIVLSSTWRLSIEMRELIPDALSDYFIGITVS